MSARKRVVLYNPKAVFFDMPLALLAIASNLDPKEYEVVIIDSRVHADARHRVLEAIKGAVCFGVTVLTGSPIADALEMTRTVKAAQPDLLTVWGGWHPSMFAKDILKEERSVDVAIAGQGEIAFRELLEAKIAGRDFEGIGGVYFRGESGLAEGKPRLLADMSELTSVDYSLINVEDYFARKSRRQLDYISSTGCFFRCSFCADPFVYGRKWTAISPERMGEELAILVRDHKVEDINFQDETFFTYRDRVVGIAEEFVKRKLNITWAATMRADQGHRLEEQDWELLKKSGLRRLLIGVESGSQEMMDWMKKDIKIEYVWECAELCRKFGIEAIFPFIVGFPNETDISVGLSIDMAAKLRSLSPGFTTPVFYFKPYPGAEITQQVVAAGYELPTTLMEWSDFDYIGSSGPWVQDKKYKMIEGFRFYNKLAGGRRSPWLRPLQSIARWRIRNQKFGFPIEKVIAEKLLPGPELS